MAPLPTTDHPQLDYSSQESVWLVAARAVAEQPVNIGQELAGMNHSDPPHHHHLSLLPLVLPCLR